MYTVPYWEQFPQSEYGGLVVVVASDDEECLDILTPMGDAADYYSEPTIEWIREQSKRFQLADPTTPSGIVTQFLT